METERPAAPKTQADPFSGPASRLLPLHRRAYGKHSASIRAIVKATTEMLLCQGHGAQGILAACKALQPLTQANAIEISVDDRCKFNLLGHAVDALQVLASSGPSESRLAERLGSVMESLTWYRGDSGPFSSANFERSHAHTVLSHARGDGQEHDTVFGLSILAPYTRFPDHQQSHPRVMFPLSGGEFKSLSGEWIPATIGSAVLCAAGREFAMRCTSTPLLTLWCQKTSRIEADGRARAMAAAGTRRRRARTLALPPDLT